MSDSSDDESLCPEEKQFRRRFEQVAKAIQGSNIRVDLKDRIYKYLKDTRDYKSTVDYLTREVEKQKVGQSSSIPVVATSSSQTSPQKSFDFSDRELSVQVDTDTETEVEEDQEPLESTSALISVQDTAVKSQDKGAVNSPLASGPLQLPQPQLFSTPLPSVVVPVSLSSYFASAIRQSSPSGQPSSLPLSATFSRLTTPVQTASSVPIQTPATQASQQTIAMATLTAADITQITNIVSQHTQDHNDAKIRPFSGLQREAVSWLEDFEFIANSNNWNDDKKIVKLGAYLTGNGRDWYTLEVVNMANRTWQRVKDSFHSQFLPSDYSSHLRDEFRNRKQKLYEPSANYVVAMRSILRKSGQQLTEQEAVDWIISNLLPEIRKEVRLKKPATFTELTEFANLVEFALKSSQGDEEAVKAVTRQLNEVSLATVSDQANAIQPQGGRGRGPPQYDRGGNWRDRRGRPRCWTCNNLGHVSYNCRAQFSQGYRGRNNRGRGGRRGRGRGRGWNNSGGGNNFDNRRPYNQQYGQNYYPQYSQQTNAVQPVVTEPTQQLQILNVIGAIGSTNGFFVEVFITSANACVRAVALIDTGAVATFKSDRFAGESGLAVEKWQGPGYQLANGQIVKPVGSVKVRLSLTLEDKTKRADISMFVMKNLTHQVVLGANLIRAFGMNINAVNDAVSF